MKQLGVDIAELGEKLSPLGFRFVFKDELPSEEKTKEIEKIVKEAE
jgi:hypothetical protein